MVEALQWQSGKATPKQGKDIPSEHILHAVRRTGVEVVALCFIA